MYFLRSLHCKNVRIILTFLQTATGSLSVSSVTKIPCGIVLTSVQSDHVLVFVCLTFKSKYSSLLTAVYTAVMVPSSGQIVQNSARMKLFRPKIIIRRHDDYFRATQLWFLDQMTFHRLDLLPLAPQHVSRRCLRV